MFANDLRCPRGAQDTRSLRTTLPSTMTIATAVITRSSNEHAITKTTTATTAAPPPKPKPKPKPKARGGQSREPKAAKVEGGSCGAKTGAESSARGIARRSRTSAAAHRRASDRRAGGGTRSHGAPD